MKGGAMYCGLMKMFYARQYFEWAYNANQVHFSSLYISNFTRP